MDAAGDRQRLLLKQPLCEEAWVVSSLSDDVVRK